MGWSTEHWDRWSATSLPTYLENQNTRDNELVTYKVLASSLVRFRTWYAALEIIYKETGKREVIALVTLVHMQPNSYHNLGTKAMSEDAGPCERECPKRILELLTPTTSTHAQGWRKDCWDRLNKKTTSLKSGHWVLFEREIQFKGGESFRLMKVHNARRRWFTGSNSNAGLYRVTKLQYHPFKLLPKLDQMPAEDLLLLIGDDVDLNRWIGLRVNQAARNEALL